MVSQENKEIILDLSSQEIQVVDDGHGCFWTQFSNKRYEILKTLLGKVYDFFGALSHYDFVLTDGLEEAISQVVKSHYQRHMFSSGKCHIITSSNMPSAFLQALDELKIFGVEVSYIKYNANGLLDVDHLKSIINPRTSLISMMWAHPITGVIQPLHDVTELCRSHDVSLHVDMTGAIGQLDISMEDTGIDYMTFSCTKNSKNYAGIIAKPLMQLMPLICGYGIQKLKGGDFNLEKLEALSKCLDLLKEDLYGRILEKTTIKKQLVSQFKQTLPESNVLFETSETLPSVLVLSWKAFHSEHLSYLLMGKNIAVSIGGYRFPALKRILLEMGIEDKTAQSAICLNLERITLEDLPKILTAFVEIQLSYKRGGIS